MLREFTRLLLVVSFFEKSGVHELTEDDRQVAEYQFATDGQHDDAEELAGDVERRLAHIAAQPVGSQQDGIENDGIEQQGDKQVEGVVLGRDGEQGGKSAGAGIHGECQRDDTALARKVVVLEDSDIQNHLEGHEEDHKATGDSEVLDLNAKQLEDELAGKKESDQDAESSETNAVGMDAHASFFHIQSDRHIAKWVDNSNKENEAAKNLPNIKLADNFSP